MTTGRSKSCLAKKKSAAAKPGVTHKKFGTLEQYQTLLERSPHGYLFLDEQATILAVNAAAAHLLRSEKAQLHQQNLASFIDPEFHPVHRMQMLAVLAHGKADPFEIKMLRTNGEGFFVDCYATAVTNPNGASLVMVELLDRTPFKFIAGKLRIIEAKWYSLVHSAPNLILLLDLEGQVLFANRPVPGAVAGPVEGQRLEQLLFPAQRPLLRRILTKLAQGGMPEELEIEVAGANGETAWWSYRIGPVRELDQMVGYVLIGTEVTEGKRLAQMLDTERQRLFAVLELVPAFVYLLAQDYSVAYANSRYRQLFGQPESQTCYAAMAGLDHPCPECPTFRVFAGKGPQHWEWRATNGRIYAIFDSPFLDQDGAFLALGMGVDITDHKQVEEALKKSEQRFQTLASKAPVGIFQTDALGKYLYINPGWRLITGRHLRQVMVSGWLKGVHPEDRIRIAEQWQVSVRQQTSFQSEYRLQRPNNQVVWVMAQASPERGEAGAATGWIGTITDITRLKSVEEALGQSEQRFRAIVEDQTELICRFLPDRVLTFVNQAFCRFFGQQREALLGFPFQPDLLETERDKVEQTFRQLSPARPVITLEHRLLLADGSIRWVHWTHRAICDGERRIVEYQSVGWETTEEKRIQEAIRNLKDELELQERHRLASALHDGVGQSLQAINLGLKMILATAPHHKHEAVANVSLQEILRELADAIEQLRTVTTALRPSFLDRMDLVEAVRWWSGKLAQRAGVQIAIQTEAGIPDLPLRIKHNCFQILQEAMTNAIKHSGAKEICIVIRMRDENTLFLQIHDQGRGFDLAQRVKGGVQGLGLTIIPERVDRMGGGVEIRSTPGHGVIISVTVPLTA